MSTALDAPASTNVLRDRRFLDAAGGLLAVYLITLVIMPKHVFWTPDEGAKWMAMHSVTLRGSDLVYSVDFPSQRVDTQYKYLPHFGLFPKPAIGGDGSIYLAFETPILFPLLTSIPYRVLGITGIYLLPLFSGWLVAVLAGFLATRVRRDSGPLALLAVGLGTPIWFYSMLFWEHTPATLLGMMAVVIMILLPPRSLIALFVALALPLLASAFRMELVALAAALPIAWGIAGYVAAAPESATTLRLRWPLPRWTLPLAAVIGAVGIAGFLDALLTVRHHQLLEMLPERLGLGWQVVTQSPWSIVDVLIHTSINEAPPAGDVWVGMTLLGVVLCTAAAFARQPLTESFLLFPGIALLLAFSVPLLLQWTTYRAMHGFIPVAPFIVFWLYAWAASKRAERSYPLVFLTALVVAALLTTLFAIAVTYVEQGRLEVGIEWGQRYLLTLYPVAGILCAVAARNYWESERPAWLRKSFVAAVTLMVFVGVGFELRGLGMLYNTRTRLATWDEALRREGPVVTDLWWLPAAVGALFTEHELYYVYNRNDVANWVTDAREHGIKGFTFVSVNSVEPSDLPAAPLRRSKTESTAVDGIVLTRFEIADRS